MRHFTPLTKCISSNFKTSNTLRSLASTTALCAAAFATSAHADTFDVNSHKSFRNAMEQMVLKRNESHTINITSDFKMDTVVAPVVLDDGQSLTINGNGFTIDGDNKFRPFFVSSSSPTDGNGPTTTISNLTIKNGAGIGGEGSGGGMGAGGGLFVDQNTTVVVDMVNFDGNTATGGAGRTSQSGGGGLGGGSNINGIIPGGGSGGGGLYGTGGDLGGGGGALGNAGGFGNAGGGGGGFIGNGGNGTNSARAGGGGGGLTVDGQNGNNAGGAGGGAEGGNAPAGSTNLNGGDARAFGGGGAGASGTGDGGNGEFGGGGGGAGQAANPTAEEGGNGGYFGGGAFSNGGTGGKGGDFGGGGGAIPTAGFGDVGTGGAGGYGGGGGSAGFGNFDGPGGAGGFGASGGAGSTPGASGFGAGTASTTGGGGGAAFGGQVFVRHGGTLIIKGSGTMTGGAVTGGTGAGAGANGQANGKDIYLQSATLELSPDKGDTQTFDTSLIKDDAGNPDANSDGTADDTSVGGTLRKTGEGTSLLIGTGVFGRGTIVDDGVLSLQGSVSSDVTVNAGLLGGIGQILANLNVAGGIVSPGNSIGTLSVTGDATFSASSIFGVEVAADGTSDKLNVGGKATLQGGTIAVLAINPAADYSDGQQYTVLTATGGVTGTFGTVSDNSAFLDFTATYDANNVFLNLTRVANAGDVAQTQNQTEIAKALDGANAPAGSDAATVGSQLLMLSQEQARKAFDDMQGEVHGDATKSAGSASSSFASALLAQGSGQGSGQRFALSANTLSVAKAAQLKAEDTAAILQKGKASTHIYGADLNTVSAAALESALTVWFGGFGGYVKLDGDGNASGYDSRTLGVSGGLEANLSLAMGVPVRVGFGIGYSSTRSDLSDRPQDADVKSWHAGIYAAGGAGRLEQGFAVRGAASYSHHGVDTTRTIAFGNLNRVASADYNTHSFSGDFEARYNFLMPQDFLPLDGTTVLSPFARLQGSFTNGANFAETGAGALNLSGRINDDTTTALALGVALTGEYDLGRFVWKPSLSIAFERLLGRDETGANLTLNGSPVGFTAQGPRENRNRLRLGSLSEFKLSESASVTFATDSVYSEDRREFSGKLGFNIKF